MSETTRKNCSSRGKNTILWRDCRLRAALCAKLGIVRSETILDSTLAYAQNPMEEKRDTVATVRDVEEQLDLTGFKTVDFYDTAMECVQAVKDGKADVAIGDRSSLNYYIYATNSALTMSAFPAMSRKSAWRFRGNAATRFSRRSITTYTACPIRIRRGT